MQLVELATAAAVAPVSLRASTLRTTHGSKLVGKCIKFSVTNIIKKIVYTMSQTELNSRIDLILFY